MIILLLGSLLCHMPDLSVGRGMHLALLTINQPDWDGCWLWLRSWDEKVAAAGCRPYYKPTHTHTHTSSTCLKTAGSAVSFLPSLFCTSSALSLTSCPLSFLLLICSQFLPCSNENFQHPSPLCPRTLSTESSREHPGEEIQHGQKYEKIRSSDCVHQSAGSGESRWKH